ncbi:hypothetical protein IV454_00505 [Massilia antarctica]|uniref:Uncharacterized protein n=1 Tax=Massilia antarctica TaxID=2765360 RepID=A0AA48WCK5_9BURK|nr:hypothetical protein [Massilia antarctica]QPI50160.1 hypothetical protein IV454_00505 [Massilia antarctica]
MLSTGAFVGTGIPTATTDMRYYNYSSSLIPPAPEPATRGMLAARRLVLASARGRARRG